MNRATLIGNVGADPVIRHTQDGKAIASLSVATSERWRDKTTGERKERTEWHRIVCFHEALSKVIEQYVKKGTKVAIEGQIQTRKYTDKEGVEKYTTEIVLQGFNSSLELLSSSNGNGPPPADSADDYGTTRNRDDFGQSPPAPKQSFNRDLDDEVPF